LCDFHVNIGKRTLVRSPISIPDCGKKAFVDLFRGALELPVFQSQNKKSYDTSEKHQDTDPLGYRKVTYDKPPADITPEEFNNKPQDCIKDQI